jgi:undecaprenyl-diphosphatase
MTLFQSIVLGFVQGLTEFLPISSTAHLRLVPALCGWDDPGAAFTAVTQLGTLAAVMFYFRSDMSRMIRAVFYDLAVRRPGSTPDGAMAWKIVAGTIPVVVFGLLLKRQIESSFRSLYVVSLALILLAGLLGIADWLGARKPIASRRPLECVGWRDALLIGLAQAGALVPGVSRSGATITMALMLGLTRSASARFSFLLSLPSVFAAGVYELYRERGVLLASGGDAAHLLLATLVAGCVGYAAIAWMIGYLRTRSTAVFVIYRVVLGTMILALLWAGRLMP